MADLLQSLLGIVALLVFLLILAVPGTIAVIAFSRLKGRIAKKFKLSWIKASFISTFIAMFLLVLVLYLIPFLQVLSFTQNDFLPAGMQTQIIEAENSEELIEQPFQANYFLDLIIFSVITILRLLFVALVLSLLLLPLELIGSAIFSKLARKKSANILAFYASTFTAMVVAVIVVFAFPWIPAGLLYFLYFA